MVEILELRTKSDPRVVAHISGLTVNLLEFLGP